MLYVKKIDIFLKIGDLRFRSLLNFPVLSFHLAQASFGCFWYHRFTLISETLELATCKLSNYLLNTKKQHRLL